MSESETRDYFEGDETGGHPSDDSTLENVFDDVDALLDESPTQIGPYKILAKLGEGGFGVV